jgi:glycosyltransferase involved in cell wall biosynthesis
VSVLMPTFKQAAFIRRAVESLRAQTLADWELVILDDGSPDDTFAQIEGYLADPRITYRRHERNAGLGAALNAATALARGRYIAYLPSDDLYYPEHLARLAALLDARPEIELAYGGLRWAYQRFGPTLQGAEAVGREAEFLARPVNPHRDNPLPSGNLLALVQVMHRRGHEAGLRWPTRAEHTSDTIEADRWRALLERDAQFAYAGAVSCEWLKHPDQRSEIIAGKVCGLARYRSHYGVGAGEWVNWQPSRGICVDERARYGHLAAPRDLPAEGGLRILLAGELGFNPERVLAFEERGHKLFGLWIGRPEPWDTAGPLPYGNITNIPFDRQWAERVRAARPDLIYALLNWQAIELLHTLRGADLGIPLVFHFKEGPFICQELGLWDKLAGLLRGSDGQIFISAENLSWFQLALDGQLDPQRVMVLDGDLPRRAWMGDGWTPKLSARDGQIHTVCVGRPLGIDPFEEVARAGIHVHFYGRHFQQQFPNWTRDGLATGHMHLHPTVEPAAWVRELSQYDAAWFHVFSSDNGGDLRRAHWDDLNLPARLGTYAAAGLPWLLRATPGSLTSVGRIARAHDVGVFYTDFADLADQLRDRRRLAELDANMRAARELFAFDTHVDDLIAFFRRIIALRK